ncbi:MAG: phytoene/squalene synthase family protein [Wenzhouxiangella sp.]
MNGPTDCLSETADGPMDAAAILQRHGRTFHLAGLFLGRDTRQAATRLYAFCRHVDDLADRPEDRQLARAQLEQIAQDIVAGRSNCPQTADFLDLSAALGIPRSPTLALIDGLLGDLGPVQLFSVDELLRYAYKVAGTVGEMMTALLGCEDEKRALPYAIDLGIAMQLTNIARDVAEDARIGRVYLPATWLGDQRPGRCLDDPDRDDANIRAAILQLIGLADYYYASGRAGLYFLPGRARSAIAVAATVYREIGMDLQRRQARNWQQRTVIPGHRRWRLAIETLLSESLSPPAPAPHPSELHRAFQDLRTLTA